MRIFRTMNWRIFFLVVAFISFHFSAQCQIHPDSLTVANVSLINAEEKVEGLYATFDEFRRNQPSFTGNFEIKTPNAFDNTFPKRYRDQVIYKPDGENEKKHTTTRFFGYCKNDRLYIAFLRFHHIKEFGHLSLIKVYEERPTNQNHPFFHQPINPGFNRPPTPTPPVRPTLPSGFGPNPEGYEPTIDEEYGHYINKWYVLDYMTGEIIPLGLVVLLDKFEQWDTELFKEFKKDKYRRRKDYQIDYLKRFNKRNPIRF